MRHFRTWYFVFSALNKYLLTVKQMTDSDAHNHKELNSDWTSPKIRSKITLGKSLLNILCSKSNICPKSRYCQFLKKNQNNVGQNCQINIDQNCQINVNQKCRINWGKICQINKGQNVKLTEFKNVKITRVKMSN